MSNKNNHLFNLLHGMINIWTIVRVV